MKVRAPLESVQQTALRLILAGLIEEVPVFHSTMRANTAPKLNST